jgi:hypothetical protein
MGPSKTLYLDGRATLRVERAGPALQVTADDAAPAWYPFSRLAYILCRGPVHWHGDALQACIQQGLVVAFLDLDDRCTGIASGVPADRLDLGDWLDLATVRPGWEQRYHTWLAAQHHRRAAYACQALGWSVDTINVRELRQRLHAAVHARLGASADDSLRRLSSLLQADIAAALSRAGLRPDQLAGFGPHGHLADDLLSLLQWPLRGKLLTSRARLLADDLRAAAAGYHRHLQPGLAATCRRLIGSLWSLGL